MEATDEEPRRVLFLAPKAKTCWEPEDEEEDEEEVASPAGGGGAGESSASPADLVAWFDSVVKESAATFIVYYRGVW